MELGLLLDPWDRERRGSRKAQRRRKKKTRTRLPV